jgi:hypothetical protein
VHPFAHTVDDLVKLLGELGPLRDLATSVNVAALKSLHAVPSPQSCGGSS